MRPLEDGRKTKVGSQVSLYYKIASANTQRTCHIDLLWYGKEEDKGRASDDVLSAELEEIKRNEAEALAEALGYAGPKRRRADPNAVSKQEIQSLVKKDFAEDEETAVPIVDEMKGLGFQR